MTDFSQADFDVRVEWGAPAMEHLAAEADCIVIIDVMSFSTCVSVAGERGGMIFPYPWKDASAQQFAAENNAECAQFDRRFQGQGFTLSPCSLLNMTAGTRLVLPSPNGSALTFKAKAHKAAIFTACFRNLTATARACEKFRQILIVPAGEKWPDNSLRPALEDFAAAGGLVSRLSHRRLSAEARAACAVYQHLTRAELEGCSSARELNRRGFAADIALCLEEDVSDFACQLQGKSFTSFR
ncbi:MULTISPECIES: 2-phosphosulfolactate phosphatase [Rahnella]|uniref:2-phosphosulfolactate phosphatase n=1 Tax=Rahnella TaxID=34037 RepID=UPI001046A800|nr:MULTISPECIES: 2-phosphosulfolactate phosphatase [Rahnella]TCQ91506.1 2-phosphosulfolactate phosphatase [Rahnella sp. JUb53]